MAMGTKDMRGGSRAEKPATTPEGEQAAADPIERRTAGRPEPVKDGVNVVPDLEPDIDRVATPSVRADGEPDQTPGFEVLPNPDDEQPSEQDDGTPADRKHDRA